MVGVEDLTIATNKRVGNLLATFPSALTRSQGSNLFKILRSVLEEYEYLNYQRSIVHNSQDILSLVETSPTEVTNYIDLLASPMVTPRPADINGPYSNSKYRTHLVTSRHSRLSDGSYGDVANYVHALSGLGHPAVGAQIIRASDESIIDIYRPFNKEEFKIHESWNFSTSVLTGTLLSGHLPDASLQGDDVLIANMTATPTAGELPLTVQFTDTSAGSPTSWSWNFGDGTTSTEQNPSHTYTSEGYYSVTLWVYKENIGAGYTFHDIIKAGYAAPSAEFSADIFNEQAPCSIQFTDLSTNMTEADGELSWYWDFGDGGTSTEQNPLHTYTKTGIYPVALAVTNNTNTTHENFDIEVKYNYITINPASIPPEAGFVGTPRVGSPPLLVQFTDLTIEHTGPTDIFYEQGPSSGLYIVDHTSEFGSTTTPFKILFDYEIHIRSVNGETPSNMFGCGVYALLSFEGVDPMPFWDLLAQTSGIGINHLTITDVGDYVGSYEIIIPVSSWNLQNENNPNYGINGFSLGMGVGSGSPVPDDAIVVHGSVANIRVVPYNPEGHVVNYSRTWDFGDYYSEDNYVYDLHTPTHTYNLPGKYTVTLTSSDGVTDDTEVKPEYIEVIYPMVTDFSATPVNGIAPLTVQFTDLTSNPDNYQYLFPLEWQWDFGDGNTSIDQDPLHIYNDPGTYDITLTVIWESSVVASLERGASWAITTTITKQAYVTVSDPIPLVCEFEGEPLIGKPPLLVRFRDRSTGNPNHACHWDFGDGHCAYEENISYDSTPVHVYTEPGRYTVSLTVNTEELLPTQGLDQDTNIKPEYVIVQEIVPLVANFVASPRYGHVNTTVRFTDTSQGDPTHWEWSLGDGTTSQEQNPDHTYTAPGKYTVTLSIRNATTAATTTKVQYIEIIQEEIDYGHGHCFWIEFMAPPLYPIDLAAAIDGMKTIKPSGVCFKGYIFNTESAKSISYVTLSPSLTVDNTIDPPLTIGAVTCIGKYDHVSRWGMNEWYWTPWGKVGDSTLTNQCDNTCVFYLLHSFDKETNAFVYDPISLASFELYTHTNEVRGDVATSTSELSVLNCKPSQMAGGVFCTYEGYGDGGYGGDDSTHIWNYHEQFYFETCWKHATVKTGFSLLRYIDFTEEELDQFDKITRKKMANLYPMNWISTNGQYAQMPWGESSWGSSVWGQDINIYERENDCRIYLEVNAYSPTLYLTVDYPAVHVRCPDESTLRNRKMIEVDWEYVYDDAATIFEGEPNIDRPAGVSVDSECILF